MANRNYIRTALAGALTLSLSAPAFTAAYAADSMKSEAASDSYADKANQLVKNAQYTVDRFAGDDSLSWVRENIGHAKGGFIFGGSGGNGVLLARDDAAWSAPAFYTMGSVTFGLQAGAEVSEIVLLVMTEKGMDALKTADVKLGGEVSVAAGPVGGGAQAQTADIIAFQRSKGLYGGLNLEGAVVTPRSAWNSAYYGQEITPDQILAGEGTGMNKASELRTALAGLDMAAHTDATGTIDSPKPVTPPPSKP